MVTKGIAWLLRSRRSAAFLDQGLVSGVNFLVFIYCARKLSPEAWGLFGFAYASVIFAQGFQRAIIAIPMIAFCPTDDEWTAQSSAWCAANLRLTLLMAVLAALGVVVMFSSGKPAEAQSATMIVLMVPPLFLMEFQRRATIQWRRFDRLVLMSLAYCLGVSLSLATWPGNSDFLWAPCVSVAFGATLSIAVGTLGNWRNLVGTWNSSLPRQAGYSHFSCWAIMSHLGFSGYNFGIQSMLAFFSGAGAVGAFHACRTFIQPVSVMVGAVDSVDKPRAASAYASNGRAGLFSTLRHTAAAIAAIAIVYLLPVLLLDRDLLQLAYGTKYVEQSHVVWLWALVAALMAIAQPIETGLYVIRDTRAMFFSRAFASVVSIAAAFWLVADYGVAGALGAMAMGYACSCLIGLFILRNRA